MTTRPDFPAYEAALPVLGNDGTLAKAVDRDSPARGHVRAKTGTFAVENALDGRTILTSKALAGYITTATDRPLIFAFFLNSLPLPGTQPDGTEGGWRRVGCSGGSVRSSSTTERPSRLRNDDRIRVRNRTYDIA